jgi:fatty-acyl-CoA synthase
VPAPSPYIAGSPADCLRSYARHRPDTLAVVDEGAGLALTYADLDERVNRLAHGLLARGFRLGDRLAVLATDSHEFLETVLACMRTGIVYVPLNVRLAESEMAALLQRARPKALLASPRYAEVAWGLREVLEPPALLALYGGEPSYEALLDGQSTAEPDIDLDPEAPLSLAFTSGTTGLPKAVVQSQRMLTAMVTACVIDYEIARNEFRYSASPMFHIAGIAFPLMHIAQGCTSLVLPQFDHDAVLVWLQSGQITGAFLVPTMISTLLEDPKAHETSYESLRQIVYGAAPITPALLKRAIDTFGCEFVQAFGAGTEAGGQCVLSSADHRRALAGAEHLLSSVGRPAFGVELRIVDENLQDVPAGTVGEIATRSAQVMSGYLDMPDETAEVFRGGWFRAGDLARTDDEGYVYLAGRSKDMIIRGGENIFSIEIESVLMEHSAVVEVAVVGWADDHWGEVVHAHVVLRDVATETELQAFCRERLAAHKVPVTFHFPPDLPRNASGKVLKRVLRANLERAPLGDGH